MNSNSVGNKLLPSVVHHLRDRTYAFWSFASAFIGYYSLLGMGLSSAASQFIGIATAITVAAPFWRLFSESGIAARACVRAPDRLDAQPAGILNYPAPASAAALFNGSKSAKALTGSR
jgi:hypothetical protein